jgi:hypothetical protein
LLLQRAGLPGLTLFAAAAIKGNWNNLMKKYISHSLLLRCSFGAFLLAAPIIRADSIIRYNPGLFDVNIAFGCNCTCWCETNDVDTNNFISVFLAANPPYYVYASGAMAPVGQLVPPHWTEFLPNNPPAYDTYGSWHSFYFEGWTYTGSQIPNTTGNNLGVTYTPGQPVDFPLRYEFYANGLTPYSTSVGGPGDPQVPLAYAGMVQPYPWNVNVTMQLQNGQYYYMEQQLVVAYFPGEGAPPTFETPVDYVETNGLLNITLLCTNGDAIDVDSATITAILLPPNIPPPLTIAAGVQSADLFTNWSWPLTYLDAAYPNGPPGSAGTTQAQLYVTSQITNTPLLVRANRAYALRIGPLYVIGYNNGSPPVGQPVFLGYVTITNTGLIPPCTNTVITMSNNLCSGTWTNPTAPCFGAVAGVANMLLGPPAPNDAINIDIFNGPGGSYAYQAPPLSFQPDNYLILVPGSGAYVGSPNYIPYKPYQMQAAMGLGSYSSYEYFVSPVLANVHVDCGFTNNLTNVFVMCPTNPGIVQGTITLTGQVDPNYYGGIGALSFLQFASTWDGTGVPQDPINGTPLDPTLQNNNSRRPFIVNVNSSSGQYLSYIQATGGLPTPSATPLASPLVSLGGGSATTEFTNPGAFTAPNTYSGDYSLQMAGLEGQESYWSPNDLHLVFGSPVNLVYDIYETAAPYTNVDISCGTVVTNNITHCFGLVTIGVTNVGPQYVTDYTATLQVSGTGPGYTVGPFTVIIPNYQHQSTSLNDGYAQLFLPKGTYQFTGTAYALNNQGWETLGTNYFSVSCTNPCLQVDCPTNKTVSCDTNWTFDLPTVISCCGSNYTISIFGSDVTTNAGACSMSSTRKWRITDCNGQTNFCSQTVTVSPPSSYSITFPAGVFELIANQLDNGSGNKISTLLSSLPNHSTVAEWNCASASLVTSTKNAGTWSTDYTLAPGQGAFVKSASIVTVTFSGTPVCPPSTNTLCPCGTESLLSYGLDCPGTYEDITGLQPQEGSTVRRWNGSGYTINTFTGGAWTLGAPVLNVGAAAYFLIPCPTNPPVPPINPPFRWGDITNAIIFPIGVGNGTFTYSNNAWSVGGYNYTLQWTTNLASPNWTTICNAVPTLGYTFTNAAPVSFYRLQQQTN